MKAAVGGIGVLPGTEIIHGPIRHGGIRAIVREAPDNAVARSAVGAIDVGIVVALVLRIEKLLQTFLADRKGCRDAHRGLLFARALANREIRESSCFRTFDYDFGDNRRWRRVILHLFKEYLELFLCSFEMNLHSVLRV